MPRNILYYVVLFVLINRARGDFDDEIPSVFKNDSTRNDFANLLQSLIKLNEQRVNVLQKLYKLEDYGVLSEVLRTGNGKNENEKLRNLFLVVLSKVGIDMMPVDREHTTMSLSEVMAETDQSDQSDSENEIITRRQVEESNVISKEYKPNRRSKTKKKLKKGSHHKKSKKASEKSKSRKKSSKRKKSHEEIKPSSFTSDDDNDDDDESNDFSEVSKKKVDVTTRKTPLRGGTYGSLEVENSKMLRTNCLSKTDKLIEKCLRACNRTHEDVCDRLKCSSRSKRALTKECKNNCKNVFDPRVCYRRYGLDIQRR